MHMHIARFLVLHTFFSLCTAGPLPQPNPSKSLPGVQAVRGSAHYKTKWIAAQYPFEYKTMEKPPPDIWTGGEPFEFRANELAQNDLLMQEAVQKCNEGHCKYHGEGNQGIAWLVTLSDQRQHILKVMFAHGTHNRFTAYHNALHSQGFAYSETGLTEGKEFAKLVYMTNRVTQLEAFGVLGDHSDDIRVFYILMPHMGLPFRLAFNTKRDEFTKKIGNDEEVFVWDGNDIISKYVESYGVQHRDHFTLNNFVFNEDPWDVRVVDWSNGVDRFTARPSYAQIADLVVKVRDPKQGYYNDKNNDHKKNTNEIGQFFHEIAASKSRGSPLPKGFH